MRFCKSRHYFRSLTIDAQVDQRYSGRCSHSYVFAHDSVSSVQAIGEMSILYPLSGGFYMLANRLFAAFCLVSVHSLIYYQVSRSRFRFCYGMELLFTMGCCFTAGNNCSRNHRAILDNVCTYSCMDHSILGRHKCVHTDLIDCVNSDHM